MRRLLPLLLPLALLLAACGDDDDATTNTADGGGHMADEMGHGDNSGVADGARVVEVGATSFAFDPPEIHAATGEDLAIELTSDDVEHDFTIDELDAHVAADAGDRARGGFNTGREPGTYTYYCSVAGHREEGMEGELVVEAA
jgi:plastocyanin